MSKQRYGNELHPLYSRWLSTTQRCRNPNHVSYKNYGARGITLANDLNSFNDYKNYIESLPNYSPKKGSLDRIDNNLGYQKGNYINSIFINLVSGLTYNVLRTYFTGISFKTCNTNSQYFFVEEILARSSGLCAPLMVGPKEIISISG